MSRRRRKSSREVVESVVDVVCTGRGRHRRVELEQLNLWSPEHSHSGEHVVDIDTHVVNRHRWHLVIPDDEHWQDMPHQTLTFQCTLCRLPGKRPRTVPFQRDTLTRIVVELRRAGVSDLDISATHAML